MTKRTLAADIGRTSCRVRVVPADGEPVDIVVANGASLADRDGVAVVLDALATALARVGAAEPDGAVTAIGVGATGAAQAPSAAAELAEALRHRHPTARVAVTSDVVTAHLGALAGRPGVVTVAGTGTVALGIAPDGRHHLVDGHGPLLGDAGSGTWIGRRAIAAALRHHDGRPGGSPQLAAAASERFGPLARLAGTVQGATHPWRDVAGFVPDVAAAALAGDDVARDLFAGAVAELVATTLAAARGSAADADETSGTPVSATLVGGLADLIPLVRAPFVGALERASAAPPGAAPHPEVRFVPPAGDALAGAVRVAAGDTGVHHHLVLRLPAGWADPHDRDEGPGRARAGEQAAPPPMSTRQRGT